MHEWTITATPDEASFFDDHVAEILNPEREQPTLPPHEQSLGETAVRWDRVGDNEAFIQAQGGTPDDRILARAMVAAQLQNVGLREATQNWDSLRRTADWNDIMDKARRLIQQGNVRILRNGYNNVVAWVKGDHGEYQPEIFRQDPNSRSITGSDCGCNWGEFQNQPRTRQWKKFQDRPCAHILAAYWLSQATPLDEDQLPDQAGPQDAASGGMPGAPPSGMQGPAPGPQGAPMAPQGAPGAGGQPGPSPADVLPQFQTEPPDVQPQNPASVPGLKGPTPTNPTQFPAGPGGTFSSWHEAMPYHEQRFAAEDDDPRTMNPLNNGDMVQLRYPDTGRQVGRSEGGPGAMPMDGQGNPQLAAGLVGEVLGTDPTTGMVSVLYAGKPWDQNVERQPFGAVGEHWRSWLLHRPDIKRPGPAIRRRS